MVLCAKAIALPLRRIFSQWKEKPTRYYRVAKESIAEESIVQASKKVVVDTCLAYATWTIFVDSLSLMILKFCQIDNSEHCWIVTVQWTVFTEQATKRPNKMQQNYNKSPACDLLWLSASFTTLTEDSYWRHQRMWTFETLIKKLEFERSAINEGAHL